MPVESILNGATTLPDPNVYAGTPGEFAARWNAASEERRQAWMDGSREAVQAAERSWGNRYEDRAERAEATLRAIREALAETETMTLNPGARTALDRVREAVYGKQYAAREQVAASR